MCGKIWELLDRGRGGGGWGRVKEDGLETARMSMNNYRVGGNGGRER